MPAGRCRVTETVHVLAYGTLDIGVTDTMRVGCLVDPLAALGVEVRSWQSFADDLLSGNDRSAAASQPPTGDFLRDAGLTAMAWADVILFRRFHSTHSVCTECEAAFPGTAEHEAHLRSTGHFSVKTDPLFRHVVDLIAANPSLLGGRGIVVTPGTFKDRETFMKMGSAGLGLGLGVKDFRAVFIFYDKAKLLDFLDKGWDFSGQADAAAKSDDKGAALAGAETVIAALVMAAPSVSRDFW